MADSTDARFGDPIWGGEGSTWPGVTGWNALLAAIYSKAAIGIQGVSGSRPAAGINARVYWATDTNRLYWDNGTTWTEVSPVGGGGTPTGQSLSKAGAAGAEGTSRIAARADHSHPEPAWPLSFYGYRLPADVGVPVGLHVVAAYTVPSTAAGLYMLGYTMVMATQSAAADAFSQNALSLFVNGSQYGPQVLSDCDRKRMPYSYTEGYIHAGGSLTLSVDANPQQTPINVLAAGTILWAAYLGPQ